MGSEEAGAVAAPEFYVPDQNLAVVDANVAPMAGEGMPQLRHVNYRHGHPFMGGWIPNRSDMGFDGTFHGHLFPPFDCEVIYAGLFNGWHGSHGIIIRSHVHLGDDVPTNCLYFTEGVMPIVRSGEHVKLGHPIGVAVPSPYGNCYGTTSDGKGQIEWGVAASGSGGYQTNPYAMVLGVGSSAAREMCLRFAKWCEEVLGVRGPTQTSDAGSA